MNNLDLTTVSTVALIAVLVIDRILSMLKTRGIDLTLMARQMQDLHDWHNTKDDDGVFKWMIRQSLESAIEFQPFQWIQLPIMRPPEL